MTMTTAETTAARSSKLDDILDVIRSVRFSRDPFGLVSGFRSYQLYTSLNAKSDFELAELNLSRSDLARVAVETALGKHKVR